jgi:hypothetical protein
VIESTTRYNTISEVVGDSSRNSDFLTALETFIDVYKEEKLKKENPRIPLSLFSDRKLGVLEVLVKCLKENHAFKYSRIAKVLNRNDRTIWATYEKAQKKNKEKFLLREEKYLVPCSAFLDRNLGPLEALSIYLHDELHLSFKEISRQLNRNYRTIWLSYRNGLKKIENKGAANAQ